LSAGCAKEEKGEKEEKEGIERRGRLTGYQIEGD
jgi:hypothetical protein